MVSIELVLAAILLFALSGLPSCLLPSRPRAGQLAASLLMGAGSLLGLAGVALSLADPGAASLSLAWFLPWGGFAVAIDPLSAFFLCLVFVVPTLASVYGLGYWKHADHGKKGPRLALFFGLLAASMALVVISRDALLFLIAWEVMALSAWFAATAEDDRPEVRRAGWVYLIATHIGTLFLFAAFSLWRGTTGSFSLYAPGAIEAGRAAALFVLALVGFGFKAGFMPLHVWLPGAHANAPSHVSAVMSGVMLKMGIYGIVRMTGLLPTVEAWMGASLLGIGAFTGIAGIAFAMGQQDLKRALAYSSIENIGIIGMGLGLALLGRALDRPVWIVLGLGGALLHVWNHGLFKSLLFLDAGAIIHATGSRNLDLMGGLGKRMPKSAFLFALGAVAISGLPPLNGFVGEWLLYLGFFDSLAVGGPPGAAATAVGAVALAMIGALAVACFVKLLGAIFLGAPRSPAAEGGHDPSTSMRLPMAALALGCLVLGFFPLLVAPFLDAAVAAWEPASASLPRLSSLASLGWTGGLGLALVLAALLLALVLGLFGTKKASARPGTWDCGYAAPTASMEYTASSFGRTIVGLFSFLLWPARRRPKIEGPFPAGSRSRTRVPDPVLDRLIRPAFAAGRRALPGIRVLQQGQTQLYILYILIIAIILLFSGGLGI